MARPRKEIDWPKFEALCRIHCTKDEICAVLDVDDRTLDRACKREKHHCFDVLWKSLASEGKASLRRKQMELALAGNPTMLIWMGKQQLGQRDKQDLQTDGRQEIRVTYVDYHTAPAPASGTGEDTE